MMPPDWRDWKVGDTLECVDAYDSFNNLKVGETYQLQDLKRGYAWVRGTAGYLGGWNIERFKRVER